jgi:DNA-binding protein YbaB
MKEKLIDQAAYFVGKIRTSPSFNEMEQEYLVTLVLEATREAIESIESGASA